MKGPLAYSRVVAKSQRNKRVCRHGHRLRLRPRQALLVPLWFDVVLARREAHVKTPVIIGIENNHPLRARRIPDDDRRLIRLLARHPLPLDRTRRPPKYLPLYPGCRRCRWRPIRRPGRGRYITSVLAGGQYGNGGECYQNGPVHNGLQTYRRTRRRKSSGYAGPIPAVTLL